MMMMVMMMMIRMMLPGRQSGVARQSEKYVRASAHLPCCLQVIRVNYDYDEDDDGIPDICNFFYTGVIFKSQILHPKHD